MQYDIAIIGAGWAGFSGAAQAQDLGLKVALIEKEELGGTCLNRGCIPTKSLVHSCTILQDAKLSVNFGAKVDLSNVGIEKIMQLKDNAILKVKNGMSSLIKRKNIPFLKAKARILDKNKISLGNGHTIEAKYIIIATGSCPRQLSSIPFDRDKVISSDELLMTKTIPKNLLIVGGGVIGCEFAHIFNSLGSKVTIVELTDQLIPTIDKEAARKIEIVFRKKLINVLLNTDVTRIKTAEFDKVLISVGRSTVVKDLCLEDLNLEFNNGRIKVNSYQQTNVPNIFSAGDCASSYQLAHIAAYEARIAAYNIYSLDKTSSLSFKTDYRAVPNCIFTEPEIATVGITDEQARNQGLDIDVSKFHFLASGMAQVLEQTEGFIKLVVDKKTDSLLGGVIIGPKATELINILTLAINCNIKACDISRTIFAHPTLSEIITESIRTFHAVKNP